MSAIAKALLVGALLIAASTFAAVRAYWEPAVALGRKHLWYVDVIETGIARPVKGRPLVAWVGDSTITNTSTIAAYPRVIGKELVKERGAGNLYVAMPGLDFFHFYFLTGRLLDRRPDVIVYVANLRMFWDQLYSAPRNEFCAMMRASEFGRAVRLPFYARGMTVPQVLVCPLLKDERTRERMLFVDGLRRSFREAELWGDESPPEREPDRKRDIGNMLDFLRLYDLPIQRNGAVVRMMGATVDLAVRHGARVLVVVTPVPIERLMLAHAYGPGRFAERIEILRSVVRENGGEFVDLHDAIETPGFRDFSGHFNVDGVREMASLVGPRVRRILDDWDRAARER